MKLKYISVVVFFVLCSSASYSAENNDMKAILDSFYASNPAGRALAKYCVGCTSSISESVESTYDSSKTDKPTFCGCDTNNSYSYDVVNRKCRVCADKHVATVNSVDCQKIICPMGTYLKEVDKWDVSCGMGSYRTVLINKNETYINPDNKTNTTKYNEQFK